MRLITDNCPTCGRHTDDPEEAGAYYCYDCSRYIAPLPGTPLQAELDDLPRLAAETKADWHRSRFHVITGEAS